jgi:uncharacterized membrane protein
MRRDTKIVFALVGAVPAVILAASVVCSWAIAHGASMQWRLLFRMMCHGIPHRCFELFGVPMPICARCTGIYVGMLGGMCAFLLLPLLRERVVRIAAFLAVTPLAIDGLTQLAGLRESVNPLRLATGLVAGLAFGFWILTAVEDRDEAVLTNP